MSWSRWQRIDGITAAVFQFQIDRSLSHYDVQFSRNRPSKGATKTASYYAFRDLVGYHGQIAVDPATGAILRVLIDADMRPGGPIERALTLVEYGPVKIGPHRFICPTRSIAVSTSSEIFQPTSRNPFMDLQEVQINETTFSDYQRFTSEATIFAGTSAPSQPGAVSAASSTAAAGSTATTTAANPSGTAAELATASQPAPAVETEAVAPDTALPTASISEAEAEADKEILVRALESMPGESEDDTSGGKLTLQTTSRLVDLGLVVTDKHGKPITDIKQDEIEVYDNGRRQQLSSFHVATPPPAPAASSQQDTSNLRSLPTRLPTPPPSPARYRTLQIC